MRHSPSLTERPKLSIPITPKEKFFDFLSIAGILLLIYWIVNSWADLPASVPRHLSFTGKPDAWTGKWFVWFFPAICIVFYLGLSVLSRYPHKYNYPFQITEENAGRQYLLARTMITIIKTELVWVFVILGWITIQASLGKSAGMSFAVLPLMLIVIFATLGWYFYQSYRSR